METERILQKALFLFEQQKFAEAEKDFGVLLAMEPSNPYHHRMLALCMLYQEKHQDAYKHSKEAIGLDPSEPFSFYVGANAALYLKKTDEAESLVNTAIGLNPVEADYKALLSSIYLRKKEWQKALDTANEGLACEADNINCLNARATALVKLDNKEAAYETIKEALYFDPEDSRTHSNLGWGLLEKGSHKESLEHFRQALKINPNNDYAKAGMVEALKARYWPYRMFLKYAFWIGNMKPGMQWAVIIGFYIGARLLGTLAESFPVIQPFVFPIILLYSLFALTTWIIRPLSNLFLRLNVYGKYALDKEEIKCSTLVGISLLASLLSGLSFLFFGYDFLIMLSILAFTMTVIISGTFKAEEKTKGRKILTAYTLGMLAIGVLAIIANLKGAGVVNQFSNVYFWGFIIFQWVGNSIAIKQ